MHVYKKHTNKLLDFAAMLSPLYVKNTEAVAKRVEELQEEIKLSESAIDINTPSVANKPLRRNAAAPYLSF